MPSLFARVKRSNLDTHTLEVSNLAKKPLRTASGQANSVRDKTWSESLAVGSEDFVEKVKTLLKTKATNREVTEMGDKHALREQSARYNSDFGAKNTGLRLNNRHFWDDLYVKSMSYPGPIRRWLQNNFLCSCRNLALNCQKCEELLHMRRVKFRRMPLFVINNEILNPVNIVLNSSFAIPSNNHVF
jgi:hypothetical protein